MAYNMTCECCILKKKIIKTSIKHFRKIIFSYVINKLTMYNKNINAFKLNKLTKFIFKNNNNKQISYYLFYNLWLQTTY